MDDPAQRRTLDEIEQQIASATAVQEIDEKIAADRQLYLTAYFAGHDGEAQYYVLEVERLQNLRNIVQRRDSARRKP